MKQYKTAITFGAYDPLHYGHIKLFERIKEQADILIVAVSTDEYIKKNKNREERVNEIERAKAVASIKYVDVVIAQDTEYGKADAVRDYQPDAIFVGNDWNKDTFGGEGLGVPVIYLPRTEGVSSSEIMNNK